ncbi:hypothetical protein C0J52_09951 [Blattella germanica]|nr:hypothetical protein C0J52_09951 [Blattella germanica]
MKVLLCFLALVATVAFFETRAEAAQAVELVQPNPAYPGKCYHSSTKKAYAVGETWTSDKQCVQYKCSNEPDTGFLIETTSCGAVAAEPPCTVVAGTAGSRYPACCPKANCPKQG